MSSKFSIYVTERQCGGGDNPRIWYHANLMLVNEETGDVIQQIDFNNTETSNKMQPLVREGISKAYSMKMFQTFEPVFTSDEHDVKSKWLHILKYGLYIHGREDIYFDEDFADDPRPETLNCRSGVIAALRIIGIIVDLSLFKEVQGTQCTRMPIGKAFDMVAEQLPGLEEIDAQIKKLGQILGRKVPPPKVAEFDIGQGWS